MFGNAWMSLETISNLQKLPRHFRKSQSWWKENLKHLGQKKLGDYILKQFWFLMVDTGSLWCFETLFVFSVMDWIYHATEVHVGESFFNANEVGLFLMIFPRMSPFQASSSLILRIRIIMVYYTLIDWILYRETKMVTVQSSTTVMVVTILL